VGKATRSRQCLEGKKIPTRKLCVGETASVWGEKRGRWNRVGRDRRFSGPGGKRKDVTGIDPSKICLIILSERGKKKPVGGKNPENYCLISRLQGEKKRGGEIYLMFSRPEGVEEDPLGVTEGIGKKRKKKKKGRLIRSFPIKKKLS